MTRDSAAVAALDDRRRRCPISAASNVVDDASILMTNSITMSGSSSIEDVGGVDEGGSPKSSSEVSTTTSCCGGSSSSSRSGSDDDDSATVTRLSAAVNENCSTTIKTTIPPSLHRQIEDDNNSDKDSSSSSHSNGAAATTTSTSIGGRLTFYKDGKLIFQLAAHHQQDPCNNPSALTSPCRWVPVPTVTQQHKNDIKCIGEWSHHQQNKTIWPYSVTNTISDNKAPQPVPQSQPPTVKIGERNQQQFQHRTTPPPLSLISGAVNAAPHIGRIVMATTTNIVRRPSRKCSTTVAAENITDFQNQHWHPTSQLRGVPKRSQQHQHQAFMMVATEAIKVQRRLLSLPKKHRLWCQRTRKSMNRDSLSQELKPPQINLECVVRNLWCRRHTTELLLRRQLSITNSGDNVAASISAVVDITPVVSRNAALSTTSVVDSTFPNTGGSKRRSMVSPSPTTASLIPVTVTSITHSNKSSSGNSSPHKKYKLGHQQSLEQILPPQRRVVVDKSLMNAIPQTPPLVMSANNHSITAILSGGVAGVKRSCSNGAVVMAMDPENGVTTTTTASAVLTPQKNQPTPSPAPLSLLRTLLKSPSSENGSPPIAASSTNDVGYRHHTNSSRKRSVESTAISSMPSINTAAFKVENDLRTSTMAIPPVGANAINNATAVLTALQQLPTIHHPAGQLAAAGYFNVLYHQAAMAAAMAYQTHAQQPQLLPKQQPAPLLSSQFPTTSGASTTWQRQLNRRPPLLHPPEAVVGSRVTATSNSSSASTVVAPYSSPLVAATVNGSSLLPPATPSPPPPLMLHPHPVHHHNLLLHHQQQFKPAVHQPSLFHQHNQLQQGSNVKKRTGMNIGATEYGGIIEDNSRVVATLDEESSTTADCVPLNLSKDSIAENVSGTSSTARVR